MHADAAAQALTLLTAMTEAGGEVAPDCGAPAACTAMTEDSTLEGGAMPQPVMLAHA